MISSHFHITGWWLSHPSEKYEFVSWDYDIPNMMEKIIHSCSSHHQPDYHYIPPVMESTMFTHKKISLREINHQFYHAKKIPSGQASRGSTHGPFFSWEISLHGDVESLETHAKPWILRWWLMSTPDE